MQWKCKLTLDHYFFLHDLNLHHAVIKKFYLDPAFTESNSITWAMLHAHPAKKNDTAIRHSGVGGWWGAAVTFVLRL